jgi:hypothetical protein
LKQKLKIGYDMESDTLDFINLFPPTVIEMVFQHLTGKEILGATLVHSDWNDFLSNQSLTCWKDIWIQPKVSEDLKYLVESERRYQHLFAVNITTVVPQLVEIITKPGRRWKTFKIFRTMFKDQSDLLKIMQAACKSLEHLDLHTLACEKEEHSKISAESPAPFDFPRLTTMNISCHFLDESPEWINSMIASAPKLRNIHLAHAADTRMKNLIISCQGLRKLSLYGKFQDECFFKDLASKMPSRLEEFEFNDIQSSSSEDVNLSYFNAFFTSQSQTLQKFETDALLELDELKAAFRMPNFSTLTIKSFHYDRGAVESYLEECRATDIVEAKLKTLNVQMMNQLLLELLALHARGLEEIHCDQLAITDASNQSWFPKLKKVETFFMNPQFRVLLNSKAEDERSHFEQLIVEGIVDQGIFQHFSEELEELAEQLLE